MANRERKIDQLLAMITLVLYAVIITIKWIMVYQDVSEGAIKAISIIGTIVQCLMFTVLMYNAVGWTGNIILKIVFIAIALFLIASSIAVQVPQVAEFFLEHQIPMIL